VQKANEPSAQAEGFLYARAQLRRHHHGEAASLVPGKHHAPLAHVTVRRHNVTPPSAEIYSLCEIRYLRVYKKPPTGFSVGGSAMQDVLAVVTAATTVANRDGEDDDPRVVVKETAETGM